MPSSTAKRVVLYRWDRPPTDGFVDPHSSLTTDGLHWITADGKAQLSRFQDCKAVCYVSSFGRFDLFLEGYLFERRPRLPGVWALFEFRDGDVLEGVIPIDLLQSPESGFFAVPPFAKATRQRVFIPRLSLTAVKVKGVTGLGSLQLPKGKAAKSADLGQLSIFD